MLRLMTMRDRCCLAWMPLALMLAGCGSGSAGTSEGTQDEVPAATAARFAAEAANHGSIEAERGCVTETAGERLAVAQARQDDKGTPIDGWLLDVPAGTRIYVCRYEGNFDGQPSASLEVWEAADADAGGPRPALDFAVA
jgi:hypothetical protein